ncbi:phage baseplate upper protein [Bombilactobacillus folatiphilus]|uniref:Phage baseplate upper protein n=1 Tax=Bombilactobacillus folatiphilus TaxID=2923362 RepID=A0ABY4PAN2_9LACO|nr:BppU family phage baseplate upper protein [Bombilactobacillus folatiphilus]UQS82614.1 phage baseplate upper protein [Bombilactobacillus folatiphilus]
MSKVFNLKLSVGQQHFGENSPVIIRQNDVGTQISAQILTDDSTPYDLTDCTITFNIRICGGEAVTMEPATVVDAVDGKINYSLTTDDSKYAGNAENAYFRIENTKTSVIETTGQVDLRVLEAAMITDDDYIIKVSDFKHKTKGDFAINPNLIGISWFVYANKDELYLQWPSDEISQKLYDKFNNPKPGVNIYEINNERSRYIIFAFKIPLNTTKILVKNFDPILPFGKTRSIVKFTKKDNSINPGGFNLHYIQIYDIDSATKIPGINMLEKNINGDVMNFSIDLTINPDVLTLDNYFLLATSIGTKNRKYASYNESQGFRLDNPSQNSISEGLTWLPSQIEVISYVLPK